MAQNVKMYYGRVSSKDQNEARQLKEAQELGIDERNIFIDKKSGKDFDRPKYHAMLTMLRDGDEIFINSLDRLGRNYDEMAEQIRIITVQKKADLIVLDMPILDTRSAKDLTGKLIYDIVVKLLSYVAERERIKNRERQLEGIAIAKSEGKYRGRTPMEIDKQAFEAMHKEVEAGERTARYAMSKLGLKPNTYYNLSREYKTKTGRWGE